MGARVWLPNHFDEVTDLAVTPSALTNFPITNLQSNLRDKVWRSPNLNQQVITYSFGGNGRYVSAWGGWPSGSRSSMIGATIQHEMFSDASRSTLVYDSGVLDWFTFTNPVWNQFPWGPGPWGMESGDFTARLAPCARHITRVAVGSGRITINNGGAVDTPYFEMRRFWLSEYTEGPYAPLIGMAPSWRSQSQHQRSLSGALRRLARAARGTLDGQHRELRCEIPFASEAHRAAWSDICHAADPGVEIVFSPFDYTDGARLFRDHIVMGSMEVLNPVVWDNYQFWKLQLAIVES